MLEPEDVLPHIVAENRLGHNRNIQLPTLRNLCMTYIPILTHIPHPVRPEVADLFKRSLNDVVDAADADSSVAVKMFTTLLLILACLLASPRLSGI